jgi:hypothetical protein
MKTNIIYVLIAACVALVLSSCSASKNSIAIEKPISISIVEDDAASKACYVVNKDGSVTNYKSLKLVTAMLATPYLLADNSVKILPQDITAYKDKKYYAISQKEFYDEVKGHVATNVLPGFAVKEMSGQINVYSLQIYSIGKVYKKYFLQNGENGKIEAYTPALLKAYVSADGLAVQRVKIGKKVKAKKIFSVVKEFNNADAMTKN